MKLPRSFKVLGKKYRIEGQEAFVRAEDDRKLCGELNVETGLVRVTTGQDFTAATVQDTIGHEFLHAVFDMAGFKVDGEEHESLVERVSPMLWHALRDSPSLATYLTSKVEE